MEIEKEFFEAFKLDECAKCEIKECPYGEGQCGIKAREKYPPITPEIVLGLEEIIFKYLKSTWKTPLGGAFLVLGINLYQVWDGIKCTKCLYSGYGDTRVEALLKLCTQLKDEIQTEVRRYFNANRKL